MGKLFLVILVILGIGILFMCIRLLVGRSFVKFHVDQSKAMHQRGIHCAQSQDAAARVDNPRKVKEKSNL